MTDTAPSPINALRDALVTILGRDEFLTLYREHGLEVIDLRPDDGPLAMRLGPATYLLDDDQLFAVWKQDDGRAVIAPVTGPEWDRSQACASPSWN